MNKYLEKIAEWNHVGHGIYTDGENYGVKKDTGDKFVKEHDRQHHIKGLKVLPAGFGVVGAGMAAGAAGKEWLTHPKKSLKFTAATGAVGAGLGLAMSPFLTHGGNKQISRESKINGRIAHYVHGGD